MTGIAPGSPAADDPAAGPLARRFAAAVARLWPEGGRLGLAVSGGTDSLALLLLSEAAIPGRFEVASVDHGLRAAAAEECAMVGALCAARGIPHATLRVTVPPGNVQAGARAARYAALANWSKARGLSAIATAHHADDQAETLLMRLNRGSGVAGLAGVRARGKIMGDGLPLIRPLLGVRRAELAALLDAAGIAPAHDPSNADERFDRVRMRTALATADWLDPATLAVSATHLADAAEALDWAARREWGEWVEVLDRALLYRPHAPRAVVLRVVERALAHFGGDPRGGDVARLIDRLASGDAGNVAGVMARPEGGGWLFEKEPPRRG